MDVKLAASASQLGMGSYSDGPPNTSQMCQQNLFHDHAPPHSALPQSPPDCPKSQNDELSNRPFPRFPLPPFPSLFFIATGDVLVSSSSALLRHSSQNSRPRPPLRRRLNLHTNLRTLEILKEFLTPVVNRGVQVATGCCTTIETDRHGRGPLCKNNSWLLRGRASMRGRRRERNLTHHHHDQRSSAGPAGAQPGLRYRRQRRRRREVSL